MKNKKEKIYLRVLAEKAKIKLPKWEEILNEATDNIISKERLEPGVIKNDFDNIFNEICDEGYRIFLSYEEDYGKKVISRYIEELITNNSADINNIAEITGGSFTVFDRFFLSLSQSRKSRSGKTFEAITRNLFKKLDYPFDMQVVINGKPDFLMPSESHYRSNGMDCIIFTAKRTLRERWRQIVTEGTRGHGFYLATIDSKKSRAELREMLNHRIYMVCPQIIKSECYNNVDNVISFKQFFRDHLDPAMTRWKNNKVI
jgi:hypothetical protein